MEKMKKSICNHHGSINGCGHCPLITYYGRKYNGEDEKFDMKSSWEHKWLRTLSAYNILLRKLQWQKRINAAGQRIERKTNAAR